MYFKLCTESAPSLNAEDGSKKRHETNVIRLCRIVKYVTGKNETRQSSWKEEHRVRLPAETRFSVLREAEAEAMSAWRYTSTAPYIFVA